MTIERAGATRSKHGEKRGCRVLRVSFGLSVVLVCLWATDAPGSFYTESYDDVSAQITASIADVGRSRGLSASDFKFARETASTWFFVGPCQGDARLLPADAGFDAIQTVALAKSANPTEAAILEIIAILTRQGIGQSPSNKDACKYALELGSGPINFF